MFFCSAFGAQNGNRAVSSAKPKNVKRRQRQQSKWRWALPATKATTTEEPRKSGGKMRGETEGNAAAGAHTKHF